MSFYTGLILRALIGIVADRMIVNETTGDRDVSHPRMAKINEHTFFIPAGDMIFANLAYCGLRDILGEHPVDLEKIREYESIFLKQVASRFPEMKSRTVKWCFDNGINTAYVRFNSMIAGVSSTGTPYIINLGDEKQFTFEVFTRPFTVLAIWDVSDTVEKKLNRSTSQFMSAVAKESPTGQKTLMRQFLLAALQLVSKYNQDVSVEGDLLLIEKGGSQIYFV